VVFNEIDDTFFLHEHALFIFFKKLTIKLTFMIDSDEIIVFFMIYRDGRKHIFVTFFF
jgi:hypothetical protein